MSFSDLGLSEIFCGRLRLKNIVEPTSIQAEVFGPISEGQSVLGLSKTGTGKTFAYLAPLVEKFHRLQTQNVDSPRKTWGIVLVPTRELATQVARDLELIADAGQRGVVIVGGEAEEKQIQESKTTTWIIATPGRLLDLLKRRLIDVTDAKALVFDEADRLLDMGFIDEIRAIMKFLPRSLQLLFFSATLHFGVDEMAYEFGADCFRFGQEEEQMTVEGLNHQIAFVGDEEKFHALVWLLAQQESKRGIIFSNYREKVHEISSRLRGLGAKAGSLTAQLSQAARSKIMDEFRSGDLQVLLASDLAARGLDVFDIDFVVNFDLPDDPAVYVHRVGRTARAGRKGSALSFVGFEDSFRLDKLERFLGKPIERFQIPVEALHGRLNRLGPALPERAEGRMTEDHPKKRAPAGRHSHTPRHPQTGHSHKPQHQHPAQRSHSKGGAHSHVHVKASKAGWLARVGHWFKNLFGGKKAEAAQPSSAAGGRSGTAGHSRGSGRSPRKSGFSSRGPSSSRSRSSGPRRPRSR